MDNLINTIESYWTKRAGGYSLVNQEELNGSQHASWSLFLDREIKNHHQDKERKDIRVLDIGAGPGFISIILAEKGYTVTSADYTEAMLEQSKINAGSLSSSITYVKSDAQNLDFADGSFDLVISRNLTWNLQEPDKAYSEWIRVLDRRGLMMVFDANWYLYLFDKDKKAEFEKDRRNVAFMNMEDYNIGDNFDVMEDIARKMPLCSKIRPKWDIDFLSKMKNVSSVTVTENIGDILYSTKEKVNYASTPLFYIKACKD